MSFLDSAPSFIDGVIKTLTEIGIDVSDNQLDHICYRVATAEEYDQHQRILSELGKLLTEANINGRPISTYKLHEPINTHGRRIHLIELPSPKPGSPYPTGWEHAEFVIDNFEEFMAKYPHANFQTGSMDKKINPDIKLQFPNLSVKFHHKPLDEVIAYEQSL